MSMFKKATLVSIAAASLLNMTACSSSNTNELIDNINDKTDNLNDVIKSNSDIQSFAPLYIDGKAIDGYIRMATVCLDLNLDDVCSVGIDPTAISSDDGSYSLELTEAQQADKNIAKAKLLVSGGFDNDTQRKFEGSLSAPYDVTKTSFFITPISTMVAALSDDVDLETAKKEVAEMLNLDEDSLDKDPVVEAKLGNVKLLSTSLQVQKTVELLTSAAKLKSSDLKEKISKNIAKALAKGMRGTKRDSGTIAENISKSLDKIATDSELKTLVGDAALASKEAAVFMAKNVEAAMQNANSEDAIIAAALTINKTKESFVKEVEFKISLNEDLTAPIDFSQSSVINDSAFTTNKVEVADITKELTKNMLVETGVSNPTDDVVNALLADADFDPKVATFTKLDEVVSKSKNTALEVIKEQVKAFADDVESGVTNQNDAVEIVGDVNEVLNSSVVADVDDAKRLVQELRDTVATFYAKNEFIMGDVDSTTALGQHAQAVKDNIVPALKDDATKVKDTLQAVGDMAQNFSEDIKNDFDGQFKSIKTRFNAIKDAFNANKSSDDWNATTPEGDTIIWKKTVTEFENNYELTITNSNGTNISGLVAATDFDGKVPATAQLVSGTEQLLKGDGYELNVTGLVLDITNKVGNIAIVATGHIEGVNGTRMSLKKFNASTLVDAVMMNAISFQDILFEFDGEISAGGRTLLGELVINEADATQNRIYGKFSGLEGEPVVEGELKAEVELNDLRTLFDKGVDIKPEQMLQDFSSLLSANANVLYQDVTANLEASLRVDAGMKEITISANNIELSDAENYFRVDAIEAIFSTNMISTLQEVKTADLHGESVTMNEDYGNDKGFDLNSVKFVKVDNLQLSLTDVNGDALEAQANVEFKSAAMNEIDFRFDGQYAYLDTQLDGKVNANVAMVDLNQSKTKTWQEKDGAHPVGNAMVNASIIPGNGFEPFSVELVLNTTLDTLNSTLLFIKDDYKLAMKLDAQGMKDPNEAEGVLFLSDSNGVKSKVVRTKENSEINSVILRDKDGKKLATFGEEETGNNWEVLYEDQTSESIF